MISSWFFVDPSPKLTERENQIIATSFGYLSQYQSTEKNSTRILNHPLKRWNGETSSSHPSTNSLTPAEQVLVKIFTIELK